MFYFFYYISVIHLNFTACEFLLPYSFHHFYHFFFLFQSIQLFISVPLDASGIDYHVALAQNALHQCLVQMELQNELLCQLMKQTARHSYHKPGVQVRYVSNLFFKCINTDWIAFNWNKFQIFMLSPWWNQMHRNPAQSEFKTTFKFMYISRKMKEQFY